MALLNDDNGKRRMVVRFVEQAKSAGLVKIAIERAALRGVVVAPLK